MSLSWTWTDGTSFTYTNWASGEASGDGLVMELVKGVQWAPDGTWNDVPESEVKPALCQKDDGVLEAGWETATSLNSVLYLLLDTRSTWTQQNTECRNLGGHLASVPNEETNIFLLSLTTERTFIGGTTPPSSWTWTDGTPFTFERWASGEPSGDGFVIELMKGHGSLPDGTWNDVPESETKHALCQKTDGGQFNTPPPSLLAPAPLTTTNTITVKFRLYYDGVSGAGFLATACCSVQVTTDVSTGEWWL